MPDAIDVGPSFALQAADEGLWAPFQPSSWDEVPETLRDPDGNVVFLYKAGEARRFPPWRMAE